MKQAQRVLLIRNVMPEFYGGGETYQLLLAKELIKNNLTPVIVTSSKKLLLEAKKQKIEAVKCPFLRQQNWSGAKNLLLPKYLIWQKYLEMWYRFIFKKYCPIAINIQSRDDWLAATKVARRMRIKVLWTDHMDFRSWVLQNVKVKCKNVIGKKILKEARRVDKIIFISDFERENFERLVKPILFDNLLTIKNGVEDKYNEFNMVREKKGSICYLGRLVDYKGVRELIEAFLIVSKKNQNIILNIYGDGDDRKKYQELANGNNRIVFYGQTDKPLKKLAENEFFVLPSYKEGLSLSLLDAAMMKKTIIASDVDGNPEVVENGVSGLLVPAKNIERLAEAMEKVLVEPKLAKKLAQGARKKYENEFDFKQIFVKKMLPLYNSEKEKK